MIELADLAIRLKELIESLPVPVMMIVVPVFIICLATVAIAIATIIEQRLPVGHGESEHH